MKFRWILRVILFSSLLALCAPMAVTAQAARAPVILVVGDSLSAAYQIPKSQGWVSLLAQRLKDKRLPYEVANASVSGETSAGGLQRLGAALQQFQPSIVVIELGANDGLRGLSLQAMQHNLEQMIRSSQQARAKVVLLEMYIPPNYGPQYTQGFTAVYHQLAQQYRLTLVPFFLQGVAGQRALLLDDGLHPNAQAQPQLLENVWSSLTPLLKP